QRAQDARDQNPGFARTRASLNGDVAAQLFADIAQKALDDARVLTNQVIPKVVNWNIEGMGASAMHDDPSKN
ncbi:MAG TPA: hypothetical protein PKN45_12200, partial [Candidatus Limiplasma sp.]|nr:hypothetical protein [Candidatus Limiplasma sp.]